MREKLETLGTFCEYAIFACFLFIAFAILSPRLPTRNLFQLYVVPSGSMYPAVRAGSIVLVKPSKTAPRPGEIIAFNCPKSPEIILHRIVGETEWGYLTKGDNNGVIDNCIVQKQNIKGTLSFAFPYIGYLPIFVRKPVGFIIMALIPALLLCLSHLMDIKQGISEISRFRKSKRSLHMISFGALFLVSGLLLVKSVSRNANALFVSEVRLEGLYLKAADSIINTQVSSTELTQPTVLNNQDCTVDVAVDSVNFVDQKHVDVECHDRYIKLHFYNLFSLTKISYTLTYSADNGVQTSTGTIAPDGETIIDRDLYVGSCTIDGLCTPDTNVHDRKITITYE